MHIKTDVVPVSFKSLVDAVERYERQYGTPSSRMLEVFRSAEDRESPEFRRWSRLARTLEAAERAQRR